jgi:phage baseplate assembly protein W
MAEKQVAFGLRPPKAEATYLDINTLFTINKQPELVPDISAINNSISNILTTQIGSRCFQPTYGSDLLKFLFEPIDELTAQSISFHIANSIGNWEPRIDLDYGRTTVTPNLELPGFDVNLVYRIKLTKLIGTYNFSLVKG